MHKALNPIPLLLRLMGNTPFHPQWLSLRYHKASRRWLREIKNAAILDIGSGDSDHADLIGPDCVLYRVDYPATNVWYHSEPEIYADATALPIASESFDVVLLLEVLEHLKGDEKALQEIRRVLKPGGKLYLSVPFIYPIHDAPADFRRYTLHGLRHLLRQNGFEILREITHGNSFVTVLQLLNLAMLEVARDVYASKKKMGLLIAAALYPLCLCANLMAWPFVPLKSRRASCLGYFMIALRP